MTQYDKFGFEDILVYFEKYKSVTYIKPEKAGPDSALMLKIKKEGREAKEKVKSFAQKISAEFHDLEFAQCSRWLRADGQAIKLDFWVQLKNPKWIALVPSVSLSFDLDNCLDIRVDVEQDKLKNINEENPKLYHKILEQQFHLLDIPLKNNTEYRIREEDYQEYGNLDVGAIKDKYKNSKNKPLIQVGTSVESLFEKDNKGTLFDEVIEAVRVIKSYYDFVMTYNDENCIDRAESIDEEIDDLHLNGADREAIVNLRVNQNVFRDRLLSKFKHHCILCNVDQTELLIASHIKPWSKSLPKEKLDVDNGLLMCPNHDRLFDCGFISFDEHGNILISSILTAESRLALGITDDIKINLSDKNKAYLKYHRDKIFQK